jgi:hypothetical protein
MRPAPSSQFERVKRRNGAVAGPLAGLLGRIVETAGGAYFNGFADGVDHAWRIATGVDRRSDSMRGVEKPLF